MAYFQKIDWTIHLCFDVRTALQLSLKSEYVWSQFGVETRIHSNAIDKLRISAQISQWATGMCLHVCNRSFGDPCVFTKNQT